MAKREHETPDTEFDVTPTELRAANLPLQPFGGYSRAETNRLLDRAAAALEEKTSSLQTQISELKTLNEAHRRLAEEASREPESVEQAVGEVLVTAHRVAEVLRNEASQEVDKLLADARAQGREIVEGAERQAQEIHEAKVRAEDALAETEEETRRLREDAERSVVELHAEARRVRLVIDEFRNQWWNLISDALKQLELRVPSADGSGEETEMLHDDLRGRLGETRAVLKREDREREAAVPETYTMGFWTAKPGEEDAFAVAWTEFAEWIKGQPGVGTLRLVRDVNEPAKFISFADWDGIESVRAWETTDEFKERIGRVNQHTDDFTAAEAELVVRIAEAAPVT